MDNKIKKVRFPALCNYLVHVEFTADIAKTLLKYPETRNVDMTSCTTGLAIHVRDDAHSFLFIYHKSNAGTIAHESWHVVRRMMEFADVDLENEVVAYHLGYLVNQVTDFQRRHK